MAQYMEVQDELWVPRIVEFDQSLQEEWICDVSAMVGPSPQAVKEFLARERSTVVIAFENEAIVGYVIADDDSAVRGGCRGRFVGAEDPEILQGLLDYLCDKYGWVWGKLTNPRIQDALRSFGCEPMQENSSILTYRRP